MLVIMEWVDKYAMLQKCYEQIVEEALNQSMAEFIVDDMINKLTREAAQVTARVVFDEDVEAREQNAYKDVQEKIMDMIVQEACLRAIIKLGHSITR